MTLRHFRRRSSVMGWTASLAVAALLCGSPVARAADGDEADPTTGRNAVDRKADAPKVAVIDFQSAGKDDTMAKALQQQLNRDLQLAGYEPVAAKSDGSSFAETNAAARDASAKYAVSGTIQTVGNAVQILGQVSDVSQGMYAPVKASGSADDFFTVQDEFVKQVKSALASAKAGGAQAAAAAPNAPAAAPSSVPQAKTSYWSGYEPSSTPQVIVSGNAPTPPPPPLYGGYQSPYLGGGGYYDPGYYYDAPLVPTPVFPLGTVRTEYLGKLGVSIIPKPPGLSQVGYKTPSDFLPKSQAPTPLPAFNRPIQKYSNPYSRFAAPVGQPQRAAPPNLRPGTNGSN